MHLNINELYVFIDKFEQVSEEPFVLARKLQKGV